MDRRNFMAIIPAFGVMPFFSKNIVREDKKIIDEPKQIDIVLCTRCPCEYTAMHEIAVIGAASVTEIGVIDGTWPLAMDSRK